MGYGWKSPLWICSNENVFSFFNKYYRLPEGRIGSCMFPIQNHDSHAKNQKPAPGLEFMNWRQRSTLGMMLKMTRHFVVVECGMVSNALGGS